MAKISIGIFILILGYVAYPFLTVYRLGGALVTGDAATLETLVDWPKVRESIRSQFKAFLAEQMRHQQQMPQSGFEAAGTMIGLALADKIIDGAMETYVSSNAFVDGRKGWALPKDASELASRVIYAFFTSPTDFRVDLRPPDNAVDDRPITFLMSMSGGAWKLDRVCCSVIL